MTTTLGNLARTRRLVAVASSLAAAVLLSGGPPAGAALAQEERASLSRVTPPFPNGTRPQEGDSTGRPGTRGNPGLVPVGVRVAQRARFDRIVLVVRGKGTPGWVVNYTDDPRLDGSGRRVDLDGDATLDIYATGTRPTGRDYYDGPVRLDPRGSNAVEEVYFGGTFEGFTQVLAGVDSRRSFRVFTRTSPTRLIVDVRRDAGR